MIFTLQAPGKFGQRAIQRIDAAGVVARQRLAPAQYMQRRATPATRLGQHQCTGVEVEPRQHQFGHRHLAARGEPFEPARDHQVNHREQIVLESQHDALTQALDAQQAFAFQCTDRRVDRAQQEYVGQEDFLQNGTRQQALDRFNVNGDVGEFGHVVNLRENEGFVCDEVCVTAVWPASTRSSPSDFLKADAQRPSSLAATPLRSIATSARLCQVFSLSHRDDYFAFVFAFFKIPKGLWYFT